MPKQPKAASETLAELRPYLFDEQIATAQARDLAPGLETFLITGNELDLPHTNSEQMRRALVQQTRLNITFRDELLRVRRREAARAWDVKITILREYLTEGSGYTYLPFSNIPGLTRQPANEIGYDFWYGGAPLRNGESVTLIPGAGLQFNFAWAAGVKGDLWLRATSFDQIVSGYWYKARSFSGEGNRTANLLEIGADLDGKTISPLPTVATQVEIWTTMKLRQGADESYTFSLESGIPVIDFLFNLPDDKNVFFLIMRDE